MNLQVQTGEVFAAHQDCVYTLAAGDSEEIFFSAGADGKIIEWNIANPEIARLKGNAGQPIYSVVYNKNKDILAAGLRDGGLHFISLKEQALIKSVQVHARSIFDMITLPEDQFMVVSADGSITVWNAANFTCMLQAHVSEQHLRAVSISRDRKLVAFGGSDTLIRVYSLDSFKLIKVLSGHTLSVFSLAFSPEGNYLISAGRDARLRVWNTIDFQLEDVIPAHMYAIHHLAFSPNGKILASASMDKTIKLWDAENLKLLKVIERSKMPAHSSSVNRLLWASDQQLISGSDDRQIRNYKITY
jgi:WD40 repeat protein